MLFSLCTALVSFRKNRKTSENLLFVCLGRDDISKQMTELIDNEQIKQKLESDSFVAVKVESDKEDYMHFAKICKF